MTDNSVDVIILFYCIRFYRGYVDKDFVCVLEIVFIGLEATYEIPTHLNINKQKGLTKTLVECYVGLISLAYLLDK